MQHRVLTVVILLAASLFVSAEAPDSSFDPSLYSSKTDPGGLVVHEWGTFTSVAAENGSAVEWVPQLGPSELPCFVDRASINAKGWLPATVRMETPVLYFYSAVDRTVDVRIRFRRGAVTEWFPKAEVVPRAVEPLTLRIPTLEGTIAWKQVKVQPRAAEDYPEGKSNHYFAARKTDASPVLVGEQREKFLFYRGVGNFAVPVSARLLEDGRVAVTASSGRAVGDVMLFQNTKGTITAQPAQSQAGELTLTPPSTATTAKAVRATLERMLVEHGLYAKEAAAMVETWRDSWFEEGARVFYVVPQAAVDEILPLEVTPAPQNVARVFVGRIELITPAILEEVHNALQNRDRATVLKYGRFLRPILAQLNEGPELLQFAYSTVSPPLGGCR